MLIPVVLCYVLSVLPRNGVAALVASGGNTTVNLEAECNIPNDFGKFQPTSPAVKAVAFPFRTDKLTERECLTYGKAPCLVSSKDDYCTTEGDTSGQNRWVNRIVNTHFLLTCWTGGKRSEMVPYLKNFNRISPTRALALGLNERNDTEDSLHIDVFDPIRGQIIELWIRECQTSGVTEKIFNLGMMTYLVQLLIENGRDFVVKRQHFSHLPNIRRIVFQRTTFQNIEPYTFADLPHLLTLTLEERTAAAITPRTDDIVEPENNFTPRDVEQVFRLHCDCSFAWLRNLFKRRPYLVQSREAGEVATIGDFKTVKRSHTDVWIDMFSIDCANHRVDHSMRPENWQFSFNTSCANRTC